MDSDDVRRGPFAHYLDSVSGSSLLISTDAPLPTLEPEDIASLLPSAQKSMELAGYDLSREPSRDELEFDGNFATRKGAVGSASRILQNLERFRVAMNSKMIPIDFSTEGLAASGAISANRRAINSGYPLVSRFGAAQAWLALESQETRFQIVKIVWDEMGWLPGPKTFAEAASMRDDAR